MLDAYTIKKVLPRLIVAVIAVNLSWSMCLSLISISNTVGDGVSNLMLSPFADAQAAKSSISVGQFQDFNFAEQGIIGIGVGIAIWQLWPAMLPVLLLAAFALLTGYLVVIVRMLLITVMIILAPVAIALWVLPGTEQWARKWWSLYIKLLLMYPLIIIFLDSGLILSTIADGMVNANHIEGEPVTGENTVMKIIAIIARFIPYFMIAFAAKFVGGFMTQIAGFVNRSDRGLIDRARNWGDNKRNDSMRMRNKKFRTNRRDQARDARAQLDTMRGATEIENPKGLIDRARNRRRTARARSLAGVTAVDRARQATGLGGDMEDVNQATTNLQADLKIAVDKKQVEDQLKSLQVAISGLDASEAGKKLQKIFNDAVSDGNDHMARAAMSEVIGRKDAGGIEMMQNTIAGSGNREMMQAWNNTVQENYADMKAMSPHLVTNFDTGRYFDSAGKTLPGITPAHVKADLDINRGSQFVDSTGKLKVNLETLAGMKAEGWAEFRRHHPSLANQAVIDINAIPALKGRLNI